MLCETDQGFLFTVRALQKAASYSQVEHDSPVLQFPMAATCMNQASVGGLESLPANDDQFTTIVQRQEARRLLGSQNDYQCRQL